MPAQPTGVTARVIGGAVYLKLNVPTKNAANGGTLALDHLDVYAVTVDAGATPPPNRTLLNTDHAIAHIPVKPPVDPDEPEPEEPEDDTRPAPGDAIGVAEPLTTAVLTPEIKVTTPPPGKAAAAAPAASTPAGAPSPASPNPVAAGQTVAPPTTPTPPSTTTTTPPTTTTTPPTEAQPAAPPAGPPAAAPTGAPPTTMTVEGGEEEPETPSTQAGAQAAVAAAPAAPAAVSPIVTRIYVVRGMTRSNRPGTPSARAVVPLVPPPPPPTGVALTYSASAVTIAWQAPPRQPDSTITFTYNVYAADDAAAPTPASAGLAAVPQPVNPTPIALLSLEHGGAEPGRQQCFVVRTVETVAGVAIESDPSERACVTPVDSFAPAAPKNLAAVATGGAINLIWDANAEADLGGYLVLRAEAPGDTLQPLTAEPIHDTRYRDATTQAGVRYVYAIVAVDRAGNRSAPSLRVEETGR